MSPEEFKALKQGDVVKDGHSCMRVIAEFHSGCVGVEHPHGAEEPLHISGCYSLEKEGE